MAFKKGDPKPPASGRKKGTPNKRTTKLRELLAEHGCDVEKALAEAILCSDIEMIEALAKVLPYLQPKLNATDAEPKPETPAPAPATPPASPEDLRKLIALASNDDPPPRKSR